MASTADDWIYEVACPKCRVAKNRPCLTKSGGLTKSPHRPRALLAAIERDMKVLDAAVEEAKRVTRQEDYVRTREDR